MEKTKKPSKRLFWMIKDPVRGQKKGARIEHLLCETFAGLSTVLPENWWTVERNIGEKGLSSLTDWERTQALEELFLCARSRAVLVICDGCDILFDEEDATFDSLHDLTFCSACQKNEEAEAWFRHTHSAEVLR